MKHVRHVVGLVVWGLSVVWGVGCQQPAERLPSDPRPVVLDGQEWMFAQPQILHTGPAFMGTMQPRSSVSIRARLTGTVRQLNVAVGDSVRVGDVIASVTPSVVYDVVQPTQEAIRELEAALGALQRAASALATAGTPVSAQTREDLRQADIRLRQAKGRAAIADQKTDHASVFAPISGVVANVGVQVGDAVGAGTVLYTLVDRSAYVLETTVSRAIPVAIAAGMPATVVLDGVPNRTWLGMVTAVDTLTGRNGSVLRLRMSFPNPEALQATNVYGTGRVVTTQRNVLALPRVAIANLSSQPTITRLRGGRTEKIPVRVGIHDVYTSWVEIMDGITPQDTVLLGSRMNLPQGTRVRLTR